MKRYTRKDAFSYEPKGNIQEQKCYLYLMDSSKWANFRNYMQGVCTMPWYGYIFLGLGIGLGCLIANGYVVLITMAVLLLTLCGVALYTAHTYSKLADMGTYFGISKDGLSYVVEVEDEEGSHLQAFSTSSWYDLNLVCVFDKFVMFKFVATSEMRIAFVPTEGIREDDPYLDEIMTFWKQNGKDQPRGQRNNRMLWWLLIIGLIALKFVLRNS